MTSIEEVVDRIEAWRGREVAMTELSGGLTNTNHLVMVDGERYVVRIPGASTELLAIDRDNERHNAAAAATTGVSPAIVEVLEDLDVMVIEYIEGTTMTGESLRSPEQVRRIASSLLRLHAGPRFRKDFDMFRLTERSPATVPCHNDLLAENYIDDGEQLWIVDFEYSGNNDPAFELGDTAQECAFDPDLRATLCEAYFGEATPALLARMELQAVMADVGWTLWAAIQAEISTIDYDFWGWAVERWDRALAVFGSEDFGRSLGVASR